MRRQSSLVRPGFARLLASAAVTALLAASLGGCQTMADVTGAITQKSDPAPVDPRQAVEVAGYCRDFNGEDAKIAAIHRPGRTGPTPPINQPLGLTVYCWRVRLHSPEIVS